MVFKHSSCSISLKLVIVCNIPRSIQVGNILLTLSPTSPRFYLSAEQVFENTLEKEEIAHDEQFLLFPQCFLLFFAISLNLKLSFSKSLSLEESQMCRFGKGLTVGTKNIFYLRDSTY